MITRPSNWDSVQANNGAFPRLPAGGYVVAIKGANIRRSDSGYEYLDLTIDICEGDHAWYFTEEYKAQTFDPKRYKGHFRQGLPVNDQAAGYFKAMITAIEESSPGYKWNWDEQSLVGKKVGCLFRDEAWEYNGNSGIRTAAFRMTSADKIRSGDFQVPTPKYPSKQQETIATPAGFDDINDEDIPF